MWLQVDVSNGSSFIVRVRADNFPSAAWISLPISGQANLTDATETYYSTVPVMLGTPPQEVDMTINTYSTLLAAFAEDCTFCAGSTFFDHSLSSSFAVRTLPRDVA